MPITISGSGTITGLTTGGLPNGSIAAADIAAGVIPAAFSLSNAEDGTGTNFEFNSGFGSNGVAYGARAWIRFDGSAGTIGTGAGNGNMDAVTDNGTGDYTVNFTTDMPDANYAIVVTSANTGTTSSWTSGMKEHKLSQAAGSCRIIGHHGTDTGEARNMSNVNVVVFR
jgi:hypothetical protein